MWWPDWLASLWLRRSEWAPRGSRRDRLAMLLALATVFVLAASVLFSKGRQFMMPGPLTSAHSSIETCSTCHTKSGDGKVSWAHGLVAGDPVADSKACLTCHKMPDTAFNAHGATVAILKQSTERLTKVAAKTPVPQSARVQSAAFPTHDMTAHGVTCATCHQEHQGGAFNLKRVSDAQCRSCHVVKFDSFDGGHPKFEDYPFKRRTRITFDHAEHFGKHYPEVAKKQPAKRIPETCSTCHDSRDDKRVMSVVPFDRTCSGCHLDQIVGKERVSGPKGIAFLSLPGLDVPTLKAKNAEIGEWPEASEAALTPFMKVMIGRTEKGRALLKAIDGLNLQDLAAANDAQIKAVTKLVWEVKGLVHALIKGKASDVLGDFNIGGGAKLSANLVADLTASIPRDVMLSAQQQWLPNLGSEMAARPAASEPEKGGWSAEIKPPKPTVGAEGALRTDSATDAAAAGAGAGERRRPATELPGRMRAGIDFAQTAQLGEPAPQPEPKADAEAEEPRATNPRRIPLPSGTPRSIGAGSKSGGEGADQDDDAASARKPANAATPNGESASKPAQPDGAAGKAEPANATSGGDKAATAPAAQDSNPGAQTDDLLFPTEEELRGIKASGNDASPAPKSDAPASAPAVAAPAGATPGDTPATPGSAAQAAPQAPAQPIISIDSDVDPESWAEYGGWYRQDFTIFYRPTGHKDKFVYAWLFLTGPQAPRGATTPVAAVFDTLTGKDAQGSCTKCHSVDDITGKGRVVNFSPPSAASKVGQFTSFIHEPHFGIMDDRGCLTCHKLEKGRPSLEKDRPYLKSYEQGDPHTFTSNFGAVNKDLCQGCHTQTVARQDCLTCHKYHVNGVVTPIISTKLPTQ